MTKKLAPIGRRTVVAFVLTAAFLPRQTLGQQPSDPASQEAAGMKIRLTFNGRTLTSTLYNNPSTRDFASMLPLDLMIDNYADNEKIAYLPRKLTEKGSGPFGNEQPYDLCYFKPWGNLAMFYADYRYSSGLIRLGRFDEGQDALHVPGQFPLQIERIA